MTTRFTVAQANRMLPLVRRIVDDIVRGFERWEALVRDFEVAAARSRADAPDADAESLQAEALRVAADIEACRAELESLGVECKAYNTGLVDFPSQIDGRDVYLCWQRGESRVGHWHERDAGFAGRRLLAPAPVSSPA